MDDSIQVDLSVDSGTMAVFPWWPRAKKRMAEQYNLEEEDTPRKDLAVVLTLKPDAVYKVVVLLEQDSNRPIRLPSGLSILRDSKEELEPNFELIGEFTTADMGSTIAVGDPCYSLDEDSDDRNLYFRIVGLDTLADSQHRMIISDEPGARGKAFCTNAQHGDGTYPVLIAKDDNGYLRRLFVDFEPEEELEEGEELEGEQDGEEVECTK